MNPDYAFITVKTGDQVLERNTKLLWTIISWDSYKVSVKPPASTLWNSSITMTWREFHRQFLKLSPMGKAIYD